MKNLPATNLKAQGALRQAAIRAFLDGDITQSDLNAITKAQDGYTKDYVAQLMKIKLDIETERHNHDMGRQITGPSIQTLTIEHTGFDDTSHLRDVSEEAYSGLIPDDACSKKDSEYSSPNYLEV